MDGLNLVIGLYRLLEVVSCTSSTAFCTLEMRRILAWDSFFSHLSSVTDFNPTSCALGAVFSSVLAHGDGVWWSTGGLGYLSVNT